MEHDPTLKRAAQRAKRASVFRSAQVIIDRSRRELACRVRNVSDTGICIDHKGDLKSGMLLQVTFGQTPLTAGRVMWATDKLAGVALADENGVPDLPDGPADPLTPTAGWMADLPDRYRR